MTEHHTNKDLFALAIAAERTAKSLYQGLAAKFANHPDVAAFWNRYAEEEEGHALWLERLHNEVDTAKLSEPADVWTLEKLEHVQRFSVEDALNEIVTLEDAYQLVNDLENSEMNAVFEFLIDQFSSDSRTQAFLRSQIRSHVANLLIEFPTQFKSAVARRAIKSAP